MSDNFYARIKIKTRKIKIKKIDKSYGPHMLVNVPRTIVTVKRPVVETVTVCRARRLPFGSVLRRFRRSRYGILNALV